MSFNNFDHLTAYGGRIIPVQHSQYHFIKELEHVNQLPSIDVDMTAVSIQAKQLVWSWLYVTSTPIIQGAVIAVDVMAWQGFVHVNKENSSKVKTVISMAQCKNPVSPLLTHESYCSLALNHGFIGINAKFMLLNPDSTKLKAAYQRVSAGLQ